MNEADHLRLEAARRFHWTWAQVEAMPEYLLRHLLTAR